MCYVFICYIEQFYNKYQPLKKVIPGWVPLVTLKAADRDTPGGEWLILLSSAGGMGSVPDQGTRIPYALSPPNETPQHTHTHTHTHQMQYCNKFS